MAHFINMCEYGYVHGQCRCPSKDKHVNKVKCTTPSHVGPIGGKHKKEISE